MKLEEIIIHIGMHKTGTTSIQRTLNKNLNNSSFAYIKLQNPNHSKEIFTLFEEKNHPSRDSIHNTEIEKNNALTEKKLIDNFNQNIDKKIIISGESIRGISQSGLINFKIFLEKYFKKITIVAYIRSPKGYMESALQQIIKNGTSSFNLNTDLERIYPNYRKFNHFFKVFGRKNVKLWKFDPKIFPHGNVVLDFCQRLGIDMDIKDVINDNESISKEALSLLYIYRKFGPGYGIGPNAMQENHKLIKILSSINGHKVKLSPNIVNNILTKHQNDIKWIEDILGTSFIEKSQYPNDFIDSEEDFLNIDSSTINKLKDILQDEVSANEFKTQSPEDIAKLIHILRKKKHYKIEIIQYWADSEVPHDIKLLTDSWKDTNKNYKHLIFNKKDAINFIKNNFEKDIYKAFIEVQLPAMQADIFRVAYILKKGGLYVDCATKCLQPIENILNKDSKLILMRKWHGGIWNGFIYSKEPNNSILKIIWNEIKNNILLKKEGNILELTGPRLFQEILQKSEYIDNCTIIDEVNVKNTFELVRKLGHRGPSHWSRMQNIEPLYTDTFNYTPKHVTNTEVLQSKQIIIHMGQYVTQSQYLQNYLTFINKDHPDILYMNIGRELSNHNNMASILSSKDKENIDNFFEGFYSEIVSSQKNIVIISSEFFSSFNIFGFNKLKMTRLWKRINQLIEPFNNKNLIYYIREQADSIELRLNELIRGSQCIKNINIKGILKNPTLDYSLFKTALHKYFPNTTISPKIYNHNKLLNYNDIYNNLFENLLPRQEYIEYKCHKKRDTSIKSITLAKILLAVNNTNFEKSEKVKIKNTFLKILSYSGNFRLLNHDDVKMIRKNFTSSNKEADIQFNKKQISIENFSQDLHNIEDINIKNLVLDYFPKLKGKKIDTLEDLLKEILIS